jgi:hypothetical protein
VRSDTSLDVGDSSKKGRFLMQVHKVNLSQWYHSDACKCIFYKKEKADDTMHCVDMALSGQRLILLIILSTISFLKVTVTPLSTDSNFYSTKKGFWIGIHSIHCGEDVTHP